MLPRGPGRQGNNLQIVSILNLTQFASPSGNYIEHSAPLDGFVGGHRQHFSPSKRLSLSS